MCSPFGSVETVLAEAVLASTQLCVRVDSMESLYVFHPMNVQRIYLPCSHLKSLRCISLKSWMRRASKIDKTSHNTGVCEKNNPPEKNTTGKSCFWSTTSGGGYNFILLIYKAKA